MLENLPPGQEPGAGEPRMLQEAAQPSTPEPGEEIPSTCYISPGLLPVSLMCCQGTKGKCFKSPS